MEKYFKIGEISKLYNIGVDSLRYYEEIGIIKPNRSESGYRLYSINDIWRLNVIRELRELGFGLDKIKEYLNSHTTKTTLELLKEEENTIDKKIDYLLCLKENVKNRMDTIKNASDAPLDVITLKNYPPRKCFSINEGYSEDNEMDILIKRLINIDKKHFYIIGNNQIGTVISKEYASEKSALLYKSVFIIDKNGTNDICEGKYLCISYKGRYEKSADKIKKLLDYAKNNNISLKGDFLEILRIDIHTSSDINEHITELQILTDI